MGLLEDLSGAFVAFTIAVDDAAEARCGGRKGPWLTSLAMWRNCMQWLPAEGLRVDDLLERARTPTNLSGMERWGYVEIDGGTVRSTRGGAQTRGLWDGVPEEIEAGWEAGGLRESLVGLVEELDPALPDTMPIVKHGWTTRRDDEPERRPGSIAVTDLGLDSLLARPLTAFALEYEATGRLSAALHANLLAVLGAEPIPLRKLPDLTGIHRAQTDNATGHLERAGLAEVAPTAGAKRGKSVALTARGEKAKASGAAKFARLETIWVGRHGDAVARLRQALAPLTFADPEHPPRTWRAESRQLARLPRFPLVTHRGGFPDGA